MNQLYHREVGVYTPVRTYLRSFVASPHERITRPSLVNPSLVDFSPQTGHRLFFFVVKIVILTSIPAGNHPRLMNQLYQTWGGTFKNS